jgi:uncharacterized protein YndB with AHSA1/START domain
MSTKTETAEAVVVERTLNAPVARVWKALIDVDQMREWFLPCWRQDEWSGPQFKPEIGFEFEFVVEREGNRYHHLCRVTEVIPQKKIAYTWRYKGEPGDSLVTFELWPAGEKTKLRLMHEGLETFPQKPAYDRKNFETGWMRLIDTELRQLVEQKQKE